MFMAELLSVHLSKSRGAKLLALCMQDRGLTRSDTYPSENKTALEKKNKRTHYVRYSERAEVCWERIVQQE